MGRKNDTFGNNALRTKLTGGMFPRFSCTTFNVILRRYSLLEVPWRRIHNVIAKAMSICVAFGNKVMDTRLPQPVGCGDKYDVLGWYWRCKVSSFCTFFKYPSPDTKASPSPARGEGFGLPRPWCDKILGTDCASRPRMTGGRGTNPLGRSMIEMLGVLAIIAVLSVGGIAGYSKAMEKFKLNKAMDEYSMLIYGLLENLDYIQKLNSENTNLIESAGLIDFAFGLNLVPDSYKKINFRRMYDPYGNIIQLFSRNNRLVIDMYLGGALDEDGNIAHNTNFSGKLCQSLMTDLVQPLHSAVHHIFFTYKSGAAYYGDSTCKDNPNAKCLSSITLSDINDICNYCIDEEKICAIVLEF